MRFGAREVIQADGWRNPAQYLLIITFAYHESTLNFSCENYSFWNPANILEHPFCSKHWNRDTQWTLCRFLDIDIVAFNEMKQNTSRHELGEQRDLKGCSGKLRENEMIPACCAKAWPRHRTTVLPFQNSPSPGPWGNWSPWASPCQGCWKVVSCLLKDWLLCYQRGQAWLSKQQAHKWKQSVIFFSPHREKIDRK